MAPARVSCEAIDQAALANTRLTANQNKRPVAALGTTKRSPQHIQLRRSADEGVPTTRHSQIVWSSDASDHAQNEQRAR